VREMVCDLQGAIKKSVAKHKQTI